MQVKQCKDCKYSAESEQYKWELYCTHPYVNRKDPWFLARLHRLGTDTVEERKKTCWFAVCGQRGKLFEAK